MSTETPRNLPQHSVPCRSAVTLIEVLFAIGVMLIGLVGLTSILPLAGRRAQESLNFDTGSAIAESVSQTLEARELMRESSLVALDGAALKTGTDIQPFCFDPMMAADPPASSLSYDADKFPFYLPTHDPLLDPSDSNAVSTAGFAGQPRMRRVGLSFPAGITTIVSRLEIARMLVESPDDLSQLRPKDRSKLPAIVGLKGVSDANGIPFARSVPTGAYSWIVTVDPDEDSRYASISVVVFRSRDFGETFPTAVPVKPSGNALGERIALVAPFYDSSPPVSNFKPTGFSGGAGGTVTLISAGNTLSKVTSNDWIMLSRTMDPADATPFKTQVHRWYRVVATEGDASLITPNSNSQITWKMSLVTVPTAVLPGGRANGKVWVRSLMLEGPDWSFESAQSTGATSNSLTYATIVSDVVSVKTYTISLSDF